MDLRKTFNTDEYNYDRSRPDFYVNSCLLLQIYPYNVNSNPISEPMRISAE